MTCTEGYSQKIRISNDQLQSNISLDTLWNVYGRTLDLDGLEEREAVPMKFPHLWKEQNIGKDTLSSFGYVTYSLTLMLDEDHPPVSLMIEDMYSAYRLFVNGVLIANNGNVATTADVYQPNWKPQTARLTTDTNTYNLVLQIANFDHHKGGATEPILVGTTKNIEDLDLERKALAFMLAGSLILGGLFFMGLYLFGKQDYSMLFFSLFCLVYTYRVIGTDYYVLHQLVSEFPWWLAIRLEYVTLFLSVFFFVNFVYNLFPEETNSTIRNIISAVSVLFGVSVFVLEPYYFTQLIAPYFIVLLGLILYGLYVFIRAYLARRPGSQYAMLSIVIVFLVFFALVADYFQWFTVDDWIIFVGYIAFFFSQSLILSYRFSQRLRLSLLASEEANQAKSDFLSTISHELRTPLNAISGLTRLLADNNPRPDQVEYLKSIKLSANNLVALVNDILDFSKIEKGKITIEKIPFLLTEVFQQAVINYEPMAQENSLEFVSEVDPRLQGLKVNSDQTRLSQVLNNLLSNAIKFTKEGQVTMKVEWIDETPEKVTFMVEVDDTGVGIAQEELEKIFYQFTQVSSSSTREFGGVGLGLTIVRNILNSLGSKVTVSSTVNEGSSFSFILTLEKSPYRKPAKEVPVKSSIEPGKSIESLKVLLVDDNVMNTMIAEKFLNTMGIQVITCDDGQKAVDIAIKEHFDIILMDIHMPVKDGYDATEEILANRPDQIIIALTASLSSNDLEKLDKYGFKDALVKPFRKEELEEKLRSVLN